MAAFVKPVSSAIICSDVPAKLCLVNRSTATSIRRSRGCRQRSASASRWPAYFTIGPVSALADRKVGRAAGDGGMSVGLRCGIAWPLSVRALLESDGWRPEQRGRRTVGWLHGSAAWLHLAQR